MHSLIIIARFVHVLAGVYWAGSIFFINVMLGPSLAAAGTSGVGVMRELTKRKYFEVTFSMATLAILSGLFLVYQDSGHFDPTWFRTSFGMGISIGMVAAILAYVVGWFVVRPALRTMDTLGARMAQAGSNDSALQAEFASTRDGLIRHSVIALVLLLIAVGAMAVARYL